MKSYLKTAKYDPNWIAENSMGPHPLWLLEELCENLDLQPGMKVLDMGCGPGLYTKRFSDMGYDVISIDYSKRSIAYAKSQDTKTEYLYKNYLEIDFTATRHGECVVLIEAFSS